jgi:hypothetical protein
MKTILLKHLVRVNIALAVLSAVTRAVVKVHALSHYVIQMRSAIFSSVIKELYIKLILNIK